MVCMDRRWPEWKGDDVDGWMADGMDGRMMMKMEG